MLRACVLLLVVAGTLISTLIYQTVTSKAVLQHKSEVPSKQSALAATVRNGLVTRIETKAYSTCSFAIHVLITQEIHFHRGFAKKVLRIPEPFWMNEPCR